MQLVLSGNRVIAHGENFIPMGGGVVINTETCAKYENATVTECSDCPSDIDAVGYEYHAGTFVPCAPFGVGSGNVAVVCGEDCKSIKDSGIAFEDLYEYINDIIITGTYTGNGSTTAPNSSARTISLGFTPKAVIVADYNGNVCAAALKGVPAKSLYQNYYANGTNLGYANTLAIVTNGFSVQNAVNVAVTQTIYVDARTNASGTVYKYIALS